jgi:hypothetical protein
MKKTNAARYVVAAALLAVSGVAAQGPTLAAGNAAKTKNSAVPDFMADGTGWMMINANATDYAPPLSGAKPISNDPKYPHVGNLEKGLQPTDRVADVSNPILKPWAAAQMKKTNDEVLKGKVPFVATSTCWPGGVPAQLLVPTNVYFIQKPNEVLIIWERDHWVRHIYLNQKHSAHPKPSWFGESVGHYENGDTLVIDTIGLSDKPNSFVDNYRTPHTTQLHVTERWKLNPGKGVEVSFTAEDPGTFNTPWGGMMRYRHIKGHMQEFACAENNTNYFGLDEFPMPQATKADF